MTAKQPAPACFFVPGPLPGLNEMLAMAKRQRRGYSPYNDEKRRLNTLVWALARAAEIPSSNRVWLDFVWHEAGRRRDPDNIAAARKYILDGLVLAEVIENDGWQQVEGWTDYFVVSDSPGVKVTVTPR